jgi:arylsulfatase
VILTDDVGFGATAPFGGPVTTPAFSKLAQQGLRYNRFHNTGICSPTRAALLTGRNHHSTSTGLFPELATGFPGYMARIPKSTGFFPEVFRQNGYSTAMFGKNHNTPLHDLGPTGPFDLWPNGMGFEYFYGFNAFGANQWAPPIYENTNPVEPALGKKDYHFDADMASHAIDWIRTQKAQTPKKPFLIYYAPGTAHAPHHAPMDWITRYKGKFDAGWDRLRETTLAHQKQIGVVPRDTKLTARPNGIPAWNSLTDQQRRVYARMMEVYAASLSHADYQIGRVLKTVEDMGESDNTLVIYIQGDNGGSAEGTLQGNLNEVVMLSGEAEESIGYLESMMGEMGGPETYGHFPVGWAWAINAPFQWTKQMASHFGGTRAGMIVNWPNRIPAKGEIRTQFHHVVDIAPTLYEAAGIRMPSTLNGVEQRPLEGFSLVYSLADPAARIKGRSQYFELMGNRGIFKDNWFANTTPRRVPWKVGARPEGNAATDYQWELYDLAKDFSQSNDLAKRAQAKLKEMQDQFWTDAERFNVLPIDDSFVDRPALVGAPPSYHGGRTHFTYPASTNRVATSVGPILNRNFTLSAFADVPEEISAEGVLATVGGKFGGWSFYVTDNRPVVMHSVTNQERYQFSVRSLTELRPGRRRIDFAVIYDDGKAGKGATATISVDGVVVATGRIEETLRAVVGSGHETFDVGHDTGTAVSPDYEVPFPFNGTIEKVDVRLN